MLNFAICDDAQEDRELLISYLETFFRKRKENIKLHEYSDGRNLLFDYQEECANYDVIFLDILMTHSNGMDIAKQVREKNTRVKIIFITTSRDFAVESYEVGVFYYLLKPINYEKIRPVFNRLMSVIHAERSKSLLIKSRNNQTRIPYSEILYIESRNTSIYVHTADGAVFRLYGKLSDIDKELCNRGFLRCHQSYIVNCKYVKKVDRAFTLVDGISIPIRRQDIRKIREAYYQYILQMNLN